MSVRGWVGWRARFAIGKRANAANRRKDIALLCLFNHAY
jgi:hypothetical protein